MWFFLGEEGILQFISVKRYLKLHPLLALLEGKSILGTFQGHWVWYTGCFLWENFNCTFIKEDTNVRAVKINQSVRTIISRSIHVKLCLINKSEILIRVLTHVSSSTVIKGERALIKYIARFLYEFHIMSLTFFVM